MICPECKCSIDDEDSCDNCGYDMFEPTEDEYEDVDE